VSAAQPVACCVGSRDGAASALLLAAPSSLDGARDLPLDLVARRPDSWDQDLLSGIEAVGGSDTEAGARLDQTRRFFAFVRGEVPQLKAKWRELRTASN
jgi:hypothetical protein